MNTEQLLRDPRYIDVKQREKCAMDAITSASQVLRQGDALPRLEAGIRGVAKSLDYLNVKLKVLSTAPSDDGQRAELQRGIDQANRQLERDQAQHEQIVDAINQAVEQRNQAAAELNACAAELVELSRRS